LTLAIKECEYWASEIIPLLDALNIKLQTKGYTPLQKIDPSFPFIENPTETLVRIWNDRPLRIEVVTLLNKMEGFAMYFATDLAAEDVAFLPTGGPFCGACDHLAVFIGIFRPANRVKLYNNLVKLYGIWKPKAELAVLQDQENAILAQKSKFAQNKPRSVLGTDI